MSETTTDQTDIDSMRKRLYGSRVPEADPGDNRVRNTAYLLLQRSWQFLYLALAVLAIFGLSYLLGHTQLEGPLSGNGIPWALSQAQWFDRWFPDLPTWFPMQAAGTPLLYLYQPGTSMLVTLISRLGGLTIIQSFRLLGFLSIPITALGIYALVWRKMKNQTVALVAALFYPMSAVAWDWLVRTGLYAQSVTIMFVPWTLLAFDIYLGGVRGASKTKPSRWRGLSFLMAASLFGLMLLNHVPTALIFLMGVSIYALMLPLYQRRNNPLLLSMPLSMLRSWSIALVGLLLVAFWMLPFLKSNALANREGLSNIPLELVSSNDMASVLSLVPNDPEMRMSFPVLFVALACLGIVAALLRKETPLVWGLLAFGAVLFVAMPVLWMDFVTRFGLLWSATNDGVILLAAVLLPATAAYGASTLPRMIAFIPGALLRAVRRKVGRSYVAPAVLSGITRGFTSVLTLGIAGVAVIYGPTIAPDRTLYAAQDRNEPLPVALQEGRIEMLDPPLWTLSNEGEASFRQVLPEIVEELGLDALTRLDVSPNQAGITEALSLYSDASIINSYGFNASLFHAMWDYQSNVFYSLGMGTTHELNQLAKWFGVKFVILHEELYPHEIYPSDLWSVVYPLEGESDQRILVRRFNEAPEMVSLLTTPTILVIGGYENAIYDQAFKTFVKGALGYEAGLVVEGAHLIDDYSIRDLREFDAVFLHGYGYQNRQLAWNLLEAYVEAGGALYVDTGWQYSTPDWETPEAPAVLPVSALEWTDLGMTDAYLIQDADFAAEIDSSAFAPLIWDDAPWSVSAPQGLRQWARPILSVEGTPIIVAGEYGAGRVVWSGMNLVGHSVAYDNSAERELLGALIGWLAPRPETTLLPTPEVIRDHPDRIRFSLLEPTHGPTSLLWREAYSPDWRAWLIVDGREVKIQTYRAGPGLTLLRLPKIDAAGAEIRLDYSLGWIGIAGNVVSLVTLIVLLILAVKPDLGKLWTNGTGDGRSQHLPQGEVTWMPSRYRGS